MINKKALVALNFFLVLSFFFFNVYKQENIKNERSKLILELAPVDPRSLLQGDYMTLRYALTDDIYSYEFENQIPFSKGYVLLDKDENGVALFSGISEEWQPGSVEFRRDNNGTYFVAVDSYFFEEGKGDEFARAKYARFYLYDKGKTKIEVLLDRNREAIVLD